MTEWEHSKDITNIEILSPTPKNCGQHKVTNIQKISSMSKFCHRNPKIVTNTKSPSSTDIYVAYFRLSNKFYLSISHYSTTSTSSTAYIIGGFLSPSIIAQYKHGQWSKVGDLSTGRYGHGSITDGVQTIIIGGNVSK